MTWRQLTVLFCLVLLVLGGSVAKAEQSRAADPQPADPPAAGKPAAGKPAAGKPAMGKPAAGQPWVAAPWQIQLSGAFDPHVVADVYDLDPFTMAWSDVTALTGAGRHAVCHVDVGVSDLDLPDAGGFPKRVLGAADGTGRRWLDIRDWNAIRPVLARRFDLCRTKGFQGVDADATGGYAARTGFALTAADEVAFDRNVASLARSYGLVVGLRSTPALAAQVARVADFTVVAGCFAAPGCSAYRAFIAAGKPVYDVESGAAAPATAVCAKAAAYRYATITKPDPHLTAALIPC